MDNPLVILALLGASLYLGKLWRDDLRSRQPNGLPGATPATSRAITIAVIGALVLVGLETMGEKALGVFDEQSKMTWLFAVYSMLGAPILEELISRGYLVIAGKGKPTLWASIFAFSIVFALVHPFLWRSDEAGFALTLTTKGFFSTAAVFAMSLWLYVSRFASWNPSQSLLPCFAAHAAKNAGVVAIKAASGFMSTAW